MNNYARGCFCYPATPARVFLDLGVKVVPKISSSFDTDVSLENQRPSLAGL